MTRDQALKIADRIMDRIEQDRAVHRDALADEILAGVVITMSQTARAPSRSTVITDDLLKVYQRYISTPYGQSMMRGMFGKFPPGPAPEDEKKRRWLDGLPKLGD